MSVESKPGKTAVRWRGEVEISRPPCLVVLYGAELGRRMELEQRTITIGRSSQCDLVADVDDVSRRHCQIVPRGEGYALIDLGSTNGTFLDGEKLQPRRESRLRGGETIRLGPLVLKFLNGRDIEALYHEEIYRLTIVDGLTGLHNRRYFEEFCVHEVARWRRYKRPLSMALLDLDGFKEVNDRFGHPAGDSVLQQLSGRLQRIVRQESCLSRIAGDEFGVILPETAKSQALLFARRVCELIDGTRFEANGRDLGELTVSIGVAEMGEGIEDAEALFEAADRNLYAAKQQGRNCVIG